MSKRALLYTLFAAIWLHSTQGLFAQAVSGNIIGTVVDQTGAAVSNVKVTIEDVGKGTVYNTTSNESGNYTATNLNPGTYKVAVETAGFKRFIQENVNVEIGRSTRVDAALEVGAATQEITVSSGPSGIETDRAEVTTALGSQQVENLPTFDRNLTSLELLLPGTSKMPWQHASSENPQGGIQINTNGQLFSGSNFMLDGTDNNDPVLGIIVVNPNVDSVAEMKVTTSNYDAEFSQAGGSVIQVETKSGSNDIHGSAHEFLQNSIFQARNPFSEGLHAPGTPSPSHRGVPPLRNNIFGGTLGGPIVKNKLFAFGDYEGARRRVGGSTLARVPTATERTGDLSGLGTPIFDPNSGNPDGTGRTQFAGGKIPSNLISPQATAILKFLPQPNLNPANAADPNYAVSGVQRFDSNKWDTRIDYYLSDALRLFGRYSYAGFDINSPPAFGVYGGPQFGGFGFEGKSDVLNQNLAVGANYNLGPSLLTEFRFGFNRYRVNVNSLDSGQNLADQVGIPGLNFSGKPDTSGLPRIIVNANGGFQMGFDCNCPLKQTENVYQFVNNWTKIRANHTVKLGADVRHADNIRLPSDQHRSGVYNFTPSVTSSLNASNGTIGGLGLASFLLGAPSSFGRFAQISTNQQDAQNRMFYFIQDTWRITPKLTFNYGVRWDTWFPDYSVNAGQGGRYDVTDNLVRIPGVAKVSKSADSQTQWRNFSPRIGIAYAVNPKTVVRTGFGRSYFQGTFGWTFNTLAADVYPSIVNQQINAPSNFFPAISLGTAPPVPVFPTIPSNGLLPLPDGISTPYIPSNQKIPYVDSWNFSVERSLANSLNVSASYVGNIGRHLNGGFGLNNAVPGPGNYNPRRPLFVKYGLTQGIFDKCDCTSSNYNGLQLKAEKRMSQNLLFLATYTWSKTIDFGEFGTPTNQYNANLDRGLATFDRASVFTLGHTYILPFGKGQRFLADASGPLRHFVEGWQWSGITMLDSGLPFSPGLGNNASLNSDQGLRPDQVGDPFQGVQHDRNGWFNPRAYAVPGLYRFGNAGRNSLRGPSLYNFDWSLSKHFPVTERTDLQFRWEAFNVFNHTNLGSPNSNVDDGSAGGIFGIASPMRNMQFALKLTF